MYITFSDSIFDTSSIRKKVAFPTFIAMCEYGLWSKLWFLMSRHISSYFFMAWRFVQDADGNKMINEYVREDLIGTGSYSKVVRVKFLCKYSVLDCWFQLLIFLSFFQVRYRSKLDGKCYALKVSLLKECLHLSYLKGSFGL